MVAKKQDAAKTASSIPDRKTLVIFLLIEKPHDITNIII